MGYTSVQSGQVWASRLALLAARISEEISSLILSSLQAALVSLSKQIHSVVFTYGLKADIYFFVVQLGCGVLLACSTLFVLGAFGLLLGLGTGLLVGSLLG